MPKSKAIVPPKFQANKELARYVLPEDVHGARVSSTAFLPTEDEKYLSVNSLEIESPGEIADYYRVRFKRGDSDVAIVSRKIINYTNAAKFVGLTVYYNRVKRMWEFDDNGEIGKAFRHAPVHNKPKSMSHCAVEFISNNLDYNTAKKIARRLGGIRPHLYKKSVLSR